MSSTHEMCEFLGSTRDYRELHPMEASTSADDGKMRRKTPLPSPGAAQARAQLREPTAGDGKADLNGTGRAGRMDDG